ncbi:MAG: folylpolyglutamate synthase/dihydrofolate synthase family protein [candidate division Zixibacteria bacterium]|nr:folylpolyglutamate synthase/dihydrofolate synthase family protein [candidate division Zixibacteria bacterium]
MNDQQAVDFLFNLEKFGIKLGLENTLALMHKLGNPHLKFSSLHIAGTNGKGSCCAMLHSSLNQAGYFTGLYTSPHLLDFRERIKVGDSLIEKGFLADFVSELKEEISEKKYTFFEVTTALAFLYFACKKIEVAVVETGLGGRLDSTNILKPEVAIITNIGLEHTDRLGRTLEKIAWEKGGIIKENVPTVTSIEREKPFKVIEALCRKKQSELISVFRDSKCEIKKSSMEGIEFDLHTKEDSYLGIKLNLTGEHQIKNAACAILALERLDPGRFKVDKSAIKTGLADVEWRGRLEVYRKKPLVILDVAHNPDGIKILVETLKKTFPDKKIDFIFGVMEDKDYKKMLQIISRIANELILTQLQYSRSAKLQSMVKTAQELGLRFRAIPDIKKAYELALNNTEEEKIICITGSHFTVSEFLSGQKINV